MAITTRPSPRTDTRAEILAISAQLFAERGITTTTVRAIADACGIQAASLYHHFASKDEIAAEIMGASSVHVVALYDVIRAANLAPVDRLEALIRATLDNFQQHPDAAQMFYDNPAYVSSAPELERVRAEARANDRLWTATIDEALAAGKLRSDVDPKQLKVMLRNMIWSTTRGLRRGRTAKRDHADGVVKLLLHGCLLADS
ncbi:MAG: TetR/AcrR family transcriptional regulator [Acidimicrobiia bacterium]